MRKRVAGDLSAALEDADAPEILAYAHDLLGDRLAIVSSFGAESVVLLHLASQIDPSMAVIFVDTRMLFAETLQYQIDVARHLGLSNVRRISTDTTVLRLSDGADDLHISQPDDCCHLRKTLPLQTALLEFDGWVTGRKRHQTSARSDMSIVEADGGRRLKFNPLAKWSPLMIADHMDRFDLPKHPMVAKGFRSLGCAPCTSATVDGEDPRAGRWSGQQKTECGIHFGSDGKITRNSEQAA